MLYWHTMVHDSSPSTRQRRSPWSCLQCASGTYPKISVPNFPPRRSRLKLCAAGWDLWIRSVQPLPLLSSPSSWSASCYLASHLCHLVGLPPRLLFACRLSRSTPLPCTLPSSAAVARLRPLPTVAHLRSGRSSLNWGCYLSQRAQTGSHSAIAHLPQSLPPPLPSRARPLLPLRRLHSCSRTSAAAPTLQAAGRASAPLIHLQTAPLTHLQNRTFSLQQGPPPRPSCRHLL